MDSDYNKYNDLKDDLGITNKDVSKITGNTEDSVRTMTQYSSAFPRWLKFALYVHREMGKRVDVLQKKLDKFKGN
jgi:hypothetical protein